MSAWDVAGAVVWTPWALLSLLAAVMPSDPPHPPYGPREGRCLIQAFLFGGLAAYCIARLCGVHA